MATYHEQINTVHRRDLINLLDKFGVGEKFSRGEMKCKFCDTQLNENNIHSILPESGMFSVVCNNPNCIDELMDYLDKKKRIRIPE